MSEQARALSILALSLFSGVGALLLSFAAWMAADNASVLLTHERANAEVVRSERIGSGSGKVNHYAVVVRYDGPRGRRTARVDRSTSHYEPGETLTIYYKPETAHRVVAGGFMAMWFFPLILAAPGLAAVFFGLRPKDLRRLPPST
ncbi:MAG: DUF3592 domain-containing protein [Rhodospirillales bacterium]|nr:MAG: DUF3592 domain-containing protein [Rhodospirillales bacterium]